MQQFDETLDVTSAFFDRMANDPTLVSLLATYDAGDSAGPGPAIFTGPNVPEDALPPYIWSYGEVTKNSEDNKTDEGLSLTRDIGCYTENDGDQTLLERISQRVWRLFHRHPLAVPGAATIVCAANGPIPAETDPTRLGHIVHVRLRVEPQ